MTICIDANVLYYYLIVTYILGLILHFAKFVMHRKPDAHDLLNLVISPVYIVVLVSFGIAKTLFPSKFR